MDSNSDAGHEFSSVTYAGVQGLESISDGSFFFEFPIVCLHLHSLKIALISISPKTLEYLAPVAPTSLADICIFDLGRKKMVLDVQGLYNAFGPLFGNRLLPVAAIASQS